MEPVTTSGPTTGAIDIFAHFDTSESALHVTDTVKAPISFAYYKAPITYGVLPDAAIPTTTSFSFKFLSFKSLTANSLESSAPS